MKKFAFTLILVLLIFGLNCFGNDNNFFKEARPLWASGAQTEQNITIGLHAVIDIHDFEDAVFCITASSCYKAYINGEFIGFGPSIAAHDYFRVDQYDLSDKLKQGRNVLAIIVSGYNVDSYYIPNQTSFIQAEMRVDKKVVAATVSDKEENAFQFVASGQRKVDVEKFSFQRTFMEEYSLNTSYNKWMTDTELNIEMHKGRRSHGRWVNPEGYNVVKIKTEETDQKNLLKRGVKYPDYSIKTYSQKTGKHLYGFDKIYTGFIICNLKVKKKTKLKLAFDELLIDEDIDTRRMGVNPFITYTLEPGEYTLESFEPYDLMYLKTVVEHGECEISDIKIRQYANSDVSRAFFKTNNENINNIFEAARETFRQNAVDIFMDCPSRERAGWLCDSYFTSRVAHYLSGNTLVEDNFIENFLLPEKFKNIPEGMLPMCYPADHTNGNFIPNWAMWFVLQMDEYVSRSGDYEMLMALKPRVIALMDYFKRFQNDAGLLENLDKWVFVEWSAANRFVQDVNYPTNMLYAKTLEIVGRLYDLPDYYNHAQKIKNIIREQAMNGIFFVDNAIRKDGSLKLQTENMTEVCQYYAFFFDVANPVDNPELFKFLTEKLTLEDKEALKDVNLHPCNAFIGNYLRMEVLSRYNLHKDLLKEIEKEFIPMANRTGTLWEHRKPTASCNHGFASHVGYVLLRDYGGVKSIDQVNKIIKVQFTKNDLEKCALSLPVGDDKFELNWERKGKQLHYTHNLPENYKIEIKNSSELELTKL